MNLQGKLTDPAHYQAYLVRLWREDEDAAWRILVTHVATGERHHFPDLAALFEFLRNRQESSPAPLSDG
jgi:hypothetical protein